MSGESVRQNKTATEPGKLERGSGSYPACGTRNNSHRTYRVQGTRLHADMVLLSRFASSPSNPYIESIIPAFPVDSSYQIALPLERERLKVISCSRSDPHARLTPEEGRRHANARLGGYEYASSIGLPAQLAFVQSHTRGGDIQIVEPGTAEAAACHLRHRDFN